MIVRSYTASNLDDALEKVRNDLGAAALVIETRALREPGLAGRRIGYEVVAAGDPGGSTSIPARDWQHEVLSSLGQAKPEPGQAEALRAGREQPAPAADGVGRELAAIRAQLARLAKGQTAPLDHLGAELVERLRGGELPDEILTELDDAVARAGSRLPQDRRELFCERYLARQLACRDGLDWAACRHLLLVGPTGVGKTTTIAKLAGELVLTRGRSVALVTIDTYRVGAGDQLRTYADLLDVPCEVARSPAELAAAVSRHADRDHVLIDTAGRSPADAARLHELRAFARAVPGLSALLAVSATSGRAEFAAVVERFSVLPIEHAVVTKLDECAAPGRLYGCLRRHRLPLCLITDGQEVPRDIRPASAESLATACLRGCALLAPRAA